MTLVRLPGREGRPLQLGLTPHRTPAPSSRRSRCTFSPEKALFHFSVRLFTSASSFVFHPYLIHEMFYSHSSQPLEFILSAVLSTHILLHQYFTSSFPPFLYLLFFLFPLSSFTSFLFPLSSFLITSLSLCFLPCVCSVTMTSDLLCASKFLYLFYFSLIHVPLLLLLLHRLRLLLCSSSSSSSSFILSLLCFSRAPLHRLAPEVLSVDEPQPFVFRWS